MSNKRVSELVLLTAAELAGEDLLLVSDTSAHESKKIRVDDVITQVLSGKIQSIINDLPSQIMTIPSNLTGSLYGTASWAYNSVNTLNASLPLSVSYASASTWAYQADTSSFSSDALSASYSKSGSYCITASYALTSSVMFVYSSAYAEYSKTASFLYYSGIPNGTSSFAISASKALSSSYSNSGSYCITASYALTTLSSSYIKSASYALSSSYVRSASYALSSSYAKSASYSQTSSYSLSVSSSFYAMTASSLNFTPLSAISASWAAYASGAYGSTYSSYSETSSYLVYNGLSNGTASYSMFAEQIPEIIKYYGIHHAIGQSSLSAAIDKIAIYPSIAGDKNTIIGSFGTVKLPITMSSVITNGKVELLVLDRWSGISQSLDSTPIYSSIGVSANGNLKIPFSLIGEVPMSGDIMAYVTASGGILLDPDRRVRFEIHSLSNNLIVSTAETMSFHVDPGNILMTYTSSLGSGVHNATSAQMVITGSDKITEINATNTGISSMTYVWTLIHLTKLKCGTNLSLTDIGGMPNSITELYCNNSSITRLPSFISTSLNILDCSRNSLQSLTQLPNTLTYLNCSFNPSLSSLADPLPTSLTTIIADTTALTAPPAVIPNTLISMSFSNIYNLTSWNTSLPTSLQYFKVSNDLFLTSLPTIPATVKHLYVDYCNMSSVAMNNICAQLVYNGLHNGILHINGNYNSYLSTTLTNISTLQSRGWTIIS